MLANHWRLRLVILLLVPAACSRPAISQDPGTKERSRETADRGCYGAIDVLLKRKANPNLKDRKGRTPVQLGIGYDSAVKMLLAGGAEPSDILVASFAGRADLVKHFLAKDKALVGAKTLSGETPLHFAARLGHVKVAEVLLAHKADRNAKSWNGKTALDFAYEGTNYGAIYLLEKKQ